jgi:hypothetical protein
MFHIWFMFDNHSFAKIRTTERGQMIARAVELFKEDGCGSLFVRDECGAELKNLTVNGRELGNGLYGVPRDEIEQWADAVQTELSFANANLKINKLRQRHD